MISFKLLIFISFICYSKSKVEQQWVAPDAWARASPALTNYNGFAELCPSCNCDSESKKLDITENISLIYYKKILSFLFKRDKLEYDENKNIFYRNILFTITSEELDKLETSTDPRDWDSVLSKMLPRAQTLTHTEQISWMKSLTWFFSNFFSIFSLSDVRFELILLLTIIIIIYIKRMHGISLVVIIGFGMFLSGYIYKYYECNRKLEIDQLADLFDIQNSPCRNGFNSEAPSFYNLWGLLRIGPSRSECMEYLRQKNKLKLPFCRPDHVFLSYVNEIILNQFQMTIEKATHIFKEINQLIPFPYNIVASIIFCLTLLSFLKLFFKYILSPKVWAFYYYKNERNNPNISSYNEHEIINDRISGESLKILLEICKKKNEPTTQKLENIRIEASSVQVLNSSPEDINNKCVVSKVNKESTEPISILSIKKDSETKNTSKIEAEDYEDDNDDDFITIGAQSFSSIDEEVIFKDIKKKEKES